MRKRSYSRPTLEVLEDRWVPATYSFYNGTLAITGQTHNMTIVQSNVTANTFTITDGGSRTFSGVSNIIATTPNGNDTVTVDLNGNTYTGALTIKTGNGNSTVNLGAAAGGTILGNVAILGSPGNQTLNVDSAGTAPLTLGGNLQVTDSAGTNSAIFGSSSTAASIPLTVRGNVSLTGVNFVTLPEQPERSVSE